mgnify:CR=1 FL=1
MQALLSFEQAPPIAAPFRFFLGAPVFGMVAGLIVLVAGPELFVSRWTPGILALTHALALGFMLQAMLGALIQILPVVAGANLWRPLWLARIVHLPLMLGVLCLAAAFFGQIGFLPAMLLLGGSIGVFAIAMFRALFGVPPTSPTIVGLKQALFGLLGVAVVGLLLAGTLGSFWTAPVLELVDVHVGWGFAAWGLVLLSAVSYVVVPMFQLTPAYPVWLSRIFGASILVLILGYSFARTAQLAGIADLLALLLVWLGAAYCGTTLWLQQRSRRARVDTTRKLWRLAMLNGLGAACLWALAHVLPAVGEWPSWPLLFGALVLQGGFVSVIAGMLYKIVPFLVWLHLQNRGQGRVMAPNMNMVLSEARMLRHYRAHLAACGLLLAAILLPAVFTYPAGVALVVANAWLAANLLAAVGVYRRQARTIDQKLAESGSGLAA